MPRKNLFQRVQAADLLARIDRLLALHLSAVLVA